MSPSSRPLVLNVGLDPDLVAESAGSRDAFTTVTAEDVQRGLDATGAELDDLGLDFESFLVDHEPGLDARFRAVLTERTPDVVLIGGGVRLDPAQTPLFETLVNAVLDTSPRSRICCNTGPTTSVEAVRRWWPEPQPVTRR